MATYSSKNMVCFPAEILEKIFMYLDGRSLIAVYQVSSFWRNVVDNMARQQNIWYNISKKDMRRSELSDASDLPGVTELRHNTEVTGNEALLWETVYKMWMNSKSQLPITVPLVVAECPRESAQVVTLTGNCVITGCSSGSLILSSVHEQYQCVLAKSRNLIIYLKCMNLPGAALKPEDRDHWSEAAHDYLLAASNYWVSLTRILPQKVTRNWVEGTRTNLHSFIHFCAPGNKILAVAVSGTRIAISTNTHVIFVREVVPLAMPTDRPTLNYLVTITHPHSIASRQYISLHLCEKKLWAMEGDQSLQLWYWPDVSEPRNSVSQDGIINVPMIQSRFWFLDEDIFAVVQKTSEFFISFNGNIRTTYDRHYPMQIFRASITAIAFNFGFLLLGTSNGQVRLYHIPSVGLENFNFHLEDFKWKVQLSASPVNSLALSLVKEGPFVAVAQATQVFIFPACKLPFR